MMRKRRKILGKIANSELDAHRLEAKASVLKTDFMNGKISLEAFLLKGRKLSDELAGIGYAFHPGREDPKGYWNVFAYKKSEK